LGDRKVKGKVMKVYRFFRIPLKCFQYEQAPNSIFSKYKYVIFRKLLNILSAESTWRSNFLSAVFSHYIELFDLTTSVFDHFQNRKSFCTYCVYCIFNIATRIEILVSSKSTTSYREIWIRTVGILTRFQGYLVHL